MTAAAKRLALVLPGSGLGGSERQALLLGEQLRLRFAWTVAIAASGDGPLHREAAKAGLTAIPLPPLDGRWPFLTGLRQREAMRRVSVFQPDIILPYTWPANVCSVLHAHAFKGPVFWNQRDAGLLRGSRRRERRALAAATRFLANSPSSLDHLVDLGIPRQRITLLPNLVQERGAGPGATTRFLDDLPPERSLVVMVANFTPSKDPVAAIHAWHRVLRDWDAAHPRPLLVLAGRADNGWQTCANLIQDLGLAGDIRYLGEVDHAADLFRAATVALHLSRSEGCPNAILEAMAAGCPVVASDLPGCRFALGEGAHLVPGNDPAICATMLGSLLRSTDRRRAEAERASHHLHARFAHDAVLQQYVEVLTGQL